jgi:hypothetical protein
LTNILNNNNQSEIKIIKKSLIDKDTIDIDQSNKITLLNEKINENDKLINKQTIQINDV